jgi:hypothetical protein
MLVKSPLIDVCSEAETQKPIDFAEGFGRELSRTDCSRSLRRSQLRKSGLKSQDDKLTFAVLLTGRMYSALNPEFETQLINAACIFYKNS